MDITYLIITIAIMLSAMVTGFITFRMIGMKLAIHFGALGMALIVTLAAVLTGSALVVYAAVALQILATLTAYTQTWKILQYNFQTSPAYAPHLALVTMLPVLALASILA
jgi:hypothetical protein